MPWTPQGSILTTTLPSSSTILCDEQLLALAGRRSFYCSCEMLRVIPTPWCKFRQQEHRCRATERVCTAKYSPRSVTCTAQRHLRAVSLPGTILDPWEFWDSNAWISCRCLLLLLCLLVEDISSTATRLSASDQLAKRSDDPRLTPS